MDIESDPAPEPDTRKTALRVASWVVPVLVAVLHGLAIAVGAGLASWATSGTCDGPASVSQLAVGRRDLAVLTVLAFGPWVVAAVAAGLMHRGWVRYLVLGALVSVVPAAILVDALTSGPADWTTSFCF
ncbi:hypothetical protein SAMN04487968_11267 [Nocardioides terrae]|uniref:Integral membrane protein n=1 Tax=Nocardioides terrae TaxID=574651 RepID=A0A1I1MEY5_9ACTN|nr:hypothetical protein [Nocardioides terrae]SFC83939.1 hypothetical protein SAMN04487968_11267 [Nocardioides terrae]